MKYINKVGKMVKQHTIRTIGRAALVVLAATLVLIGCPDSASDSSDTTAPEAVTNVTATPLPSGTEVLLRWTASSSDDVTTITISWSSTVTGVIGGSAPAEVGTQQSTIDNLDYATPYTFFITVADAAGNSTATTTGPVNTLSDLIDADGNRLIDINSLERLHNMRYNLDVGAAGDDGRYKNSTQMADDQGMLCGTNADTPCSGYELTRNLDFATSSSYVSGQINTDWRPTGGNPATATNAGWESIGSCNDDVNMDTLACNDGDENLLATRFTGNNYTISNLYARNINDSTPAAIGLVGITHRDATIDTIGIVDAFVYGSSAEIEYVGGLVGFNNGTISASYVHNSTADGGEGAFDRVGGLVGISNRGTIIASYATSSTANGGAGIRDDVGGLVGFNNSTIIASYAIDNRANGGAGVTDGVGGLVGFNSGTIIAGYVSGNSTADGGMGDTDGVGGLVGGNSGTISASYAAGGTASGDADDKDSVGGLVGDNSNGSLIASYATAAADGGTGSGDRVGSLVGRNILILTSATRTGTITAGYGFGTTNNVDTPGLSEGSDGRPSGVTTAAQLTAPDTAAATAVAAEWNQDSSNTAGAWHFGTTSDIPTLRYADYDGTGNTYGCGSDSMATIVIPDSVPDGMGGTINIECGTTPLPGQR